LTLIVVPQIIFFERVISKGRQDLKPRITAEALAGIDDQTKEKFMPSS